MIISKSRKLMAHYISKKTHSTANSPILQIPSEAEINKRRRRQLVHKYTKLNHPKPSEYILLMLCL